MQDFIPKKIDINGNIGTVTVKQFDNDSRFLHVTIIDGDLSDGDSNAFIMQDCSAALYMQPEGDGDPARVSYINGEIADPETGVVTFLIPGSVTRTPGRYECEIFIYQGNESERPVISTKPFSLVVEKSIRNDAAVMASQSFSALDAKMITVQAMQSQMNGLVASPAGSGGDTGTELRDIRTGWDGSAFDSAGEAVRTQAERSVKGIDTLLDTTGWGNFSSNFNSLPNNCVIPCSVNNSGGSISNAPYAGVLNGLIATFGGDAGRGDCDVQLFIPEDGGAVWYRQFNTRNGVQSWGAWATLYENVPQYRAGINAQYDTYHNHVYEYTKEGTFYATQYDTSGSAIVRRWDLPDLENDFIISNTRYGDNWMLQTAIQENSPDVFYRRIVPRSEPNGGHPSGGYPWRKGGDNFVQCREGINGQSATYNRHVYEYKKDGTFYVTPVNWDDLPTNNANYIVTNSRYGSWIMQTAVKSADPAIVYRRFVSNNPADDANASTFYTIAANGYGWELCEGTDIAQFGTTAASDYLTVGLPILYLSGDTSGMSKSNAVTLSYLISDAGSANDGASGSCSVKWQGSSSIVYTKKNYTITFGSAMDVGWGSQTKYCFKANYVDNTNALNVCGARLWSEIVADRNSHPAITHNAPNNGAMDGFPCILMLNGKFHGLYTWNIPKDKWAFGMGSSASEYIVTAEEHSDQTKFRTTTNFATDANGKALDFEIEYKQSDSVSDDTIKTSLNAMLTKISSLTGQNPPADAWNYLDYGTAIDYMIFSALISNTDGVDKNFILTTYDGVKWWLNAYDLDSIMGNFWTGGSYYAPDDSDARNKTSFLWLAGTSRLFNVLWNDADSGANPQQRPHRADVISRYNTLRNGILSEEHVYMTLYNFCARIPQVVIDEDNRKYPLKPGTSTETLSRIMEWYRMRLDFIDNEVHGSMFIQSNEIEEVLNG